MKKRWFAILLTLAMCLSLLPSLAMAAEEEVWSSPRLFMSAPDRDGDLRVEPASNDFATSESFGLGQGRFEIFYFGTQESYEKVALEDLDFDGPIALEIIEEAEVGAGLYGYVGRISGTAGGTGTVSYSVDGVAYTVTFEIIAPEEEEPEPLVEPGLYSQPIMAPEYYLGDELIYTGEPL